MWGCCNYKRLKLMVMEGKIIYLLILIGILSGMKYLIFRYLN